MAVEIPTDTSNILKNVDLSSILGGNMGNLLGGNNQDGLGGGVLLGLLLGRSGILGGTGAEAAYAAGHNAATPNDVQNTVGFINTIQDINATRRDIFQAQGNVQNQIAQGLQSETVNNLQGQIALLSAVNNSTQMTGNAIDTVNANISSHSDVLSARIGDVASGVLSGFGATAKGISDSAYVVTAAVNAGSYATAQAISNDGDKTRALIQSISTADLNRQIIVAQNEATELRHEGRIRDNGVTVTNNINQNATATANATAQQQIIGILGQVATAIQHNTQSTVNLGTMIGSGQTATNVRS